MDSIRNALTAIKSLLVWLPDPVAAAIILALAVVIAFSLHRIVRKLIRRLLAQRYPFAFSIFSQMRGRHPARAADPGHDDRRAGRADRSEVPNGWRACC